MDQEEIQKNLAALWKKYLPEMGERLKPLERACSLLREGHLSGEDRQAALSAAHKLAGAMGTFGRERGTDLARDVESMLQGGSPTPEQIDAMERNVEELRAIIRT